MSLHHFIKVGDLVSALSELPVLFVQGLFREPAVTEILGRAAVNTLIERIRPGNLLREGIVEDHIVKRGLGVDTHRLCLVEHIREGLAARQLLLAPALLHLEALSEFQHHPDVRLGFARSLHHLRPAIRTAFAVAVSTPLFEDHRGRQNKVSRVLSGERRVGIRHHDKVLGLTGSLQPVRGVRERLEDIHDLRPEDAHRAVFKTADHLHRVEAHLAIQSAFRQTPDLFSLGAVRGIRDQHVRRQTVRERTDFTAGTAGRGLTGEREHAAARLRLLAHQKVNGVELLIDPRAALVLVRAHATRRQHAVRLVAVNVSEHLQLLRKVRSGLVRIALRDAGNEFKRIGFNTLLEVFDRDLPVIAGGAARILLLNRFTRSLALGDSFILREDFLHLLHLGITLSRIGKLLGRTHAVTDVIRTGREDAVLLDEVLVVAAAVHDFAKNVVRDREVGVRLEDDVNISKPGGERRVGLDIEDLVIRIRALRRNDAVPENRMGFRGVIAPEHQVLRDFQIVIASGRLVNAEGLIHTDHGGSHAQTGIRVNVIRAEASLQKLHNGNAFRNRVLTGTENADAGRTEFLIGLAPVLLELIKRFLPGHGLKLAVLIELAVCTAHQRLREAILAVDDLRVVIALNAGETAVHIAVRITLCGHNLAVLRTDQEAAARTAEAADALRPLDALLSGRGFIRGNNSDRNASDLGCGGSDASLHQAATAHADRRNRVLVLHLLLLFIPRRAAY